MTRAILLRAGAVFALLVASGCTLDFDEFDPYTEDQPPVPPDMDQTDLRVVDMRPVDMGDAAVIDQGADGDGDGIDDGDDNCPMVANADQADLDGDGQGDACDDDADGDGVSDDVDNCPGLANPGQLDLDRDQTGDDCDDDKDGDGLSDAEEANRGTDPLRADTDGDGALDGPDTCPLRPDRVALDSDGDGYGDACDQDDDGDGVRDWADNCPGLANADQADGNGDGRGDACPDDFDGDGVADPGDNCPYRANPDQAIVPCEARFASINYTRSVRTLVQRDDRVYAATAGGALTVTAAGVQQTLSVADGLAGNRIAGMTVDPAGRRWLATDRGLTVVRPDGFVFNMHADDEGGGPQGTLRDVAYDPRDPGAGQPPHIWVASDAGLNRLGEDGWTLLGGDVLPSADVRGLYLDDLMRLWVATAGGVVRLADGMVDARFDGLPDIGEFEDVVSADGAGYWVVGTTGLLRIGNDDGVAPEGVYTGFAARDFADDYVATDGGLARIDAASRMLPAGTMPLPSPDVRAVATADEATRWVGTADGLVRLGSYFATYDADAIGGDCATVARRAGDYIFLGTLGGLYVVERDNSLRELEMPPPLGAQVRAILRVGEQVWVGTNNGIAVFTPAAEYVESIIDPIPGPVTDMVNGAPDEVWVGTAGGGLARRGADGQWQTYNQAGAPNQFLSDEILALAYSDGELWVATPLGLSVFQQANGSFGPPVTTQGGRLPTSRVDDVAAGGGRVFAATQAGVAVRAPTGVWTTLRRQVGGIPNEAGTDSARSVVYDGQYLWMALGVSRRLEYGSLVRRSPDPDVRDGLVLIVPEEVGLPLTGAINGVDLGWGSGELIASYCGDGQQPGGFSILGGRSLIEQSVADGLRGQGDMAALTLGPEGRPLAVGATGGGPVADLIRDGAVEDVALPDVPVPPTACGIPAVQGDNLWCVFDGIGFGRRFANNQWNLGRTESIPALGRGELRDIVVETDTVAWLASAEGVVHVNGGSVRALNTAFTGGGLPNDDVRTVALANGRLYAGTAAGVGVLDTGANQWSAIGPDMLPNASVRALAIDSTGAVWIGTDDGLFKRTEDGAGDADYDTSSGLPVNRINDIVMLPGGRVAVATPAGLAVSDGAGAFATHGFADGLPGVAAYELVLDPEGELWVRSDDGVARLITP